MKQFILTIISLSILFTSCNLFFDNDESSYVSMVSYKPKIEIKGEPIISLEKGQSTYTEQGVNVWIGDTLSDNYTITNSPDINKTGCYIIKYTATNGFGWSSTAYRSVLVWEGTPYSPSLDVSGDYKVGFKFRSKITKYSILGYYIMDNCYAEDRDDVFPIIFADNNDGKNFTIVPGEHPALGKYFGTANDSIAGTKKFFKVKIKTVIPGQDTIYKTFNWQKI